MTDPGSPPPTPPTWSPPAWSSPASPVPAAPTSERTEPFAVVSLVTGIVAIWFCFIGSILAIVFGHLARGRIKRTGERGAGMALAGLIIGYVGLGLALLGVAAIAAIVAVQAANGDSYAADTARDLERNLVATAQSTGTSPRDALTLHRAIADFTDQNPTVGTTGNLAAGAFDDELEAAGWQIEFTGGIDGRACLTVPASTAVVRTDVREGPCRDVPALSPGSS